MTDPDSVDNPPPKGYPPQPGQPPGQGPTPAKKGQPFGPLKTRPLPKNADKILENLRNVGIPLE